jgi:hypothetical protein
LKPDLCDDVENVLMSSQSYGRFSLPSVFHLFGIQAVIEQIWETKYRLRGLQEISRSTEQTVAHLVKEAWSSFFLASNTLKTGFLEYYHKELENLSRQTRNNIQLDVSQFWTHQ